jgi:hypothetical protein
MDESKVRRNALPMVVPKPRSKGWALNLPYFSVSVSVSTARRFGFWNPLQSISVVLSMHGKRREAFCYGRAVFSSLIESVLCCEPTQANSGLAWGTHTFVYLL